MKQQWNDRIVFLLLGFTLLTKSFLMLTGCGVEAGNPSSKKPKSSAVDVVSLFQDPQLTTSVINASHGDAVSAVADQGDSGGNLELMLNDSDSDNDGSKVTKTCVASEGKAVVSVTSNISRSRTKTQSGGRATVSASRTGGGSSTRTWSKVDGAAVACNNSGTGAKVDFKNPDGLRLDISFERSRDDRMTYTGTKVTRTSSKSFTSSGKRSVTWASSDSSADGATYVRNKSVVITDVTKSLTMSNKRGESFSTALTINTSQDLPLLVKVERNSETDAVISKTIVSGEIVTKKDSDSIITTNYSNLKLNLSDNSCSISSGSAQIVIKDAAGGVLKIFTLSVDSSGDSSLKDSLGEDVEGFALDPCDSEDLKL